MTVPRTDAERAERIAKLASVLGALGLAYDAITMPTGVSWIQLAAIGVCSAIALWLLLVRRAPSLARGTATFLAVNAAIIIALWASSQRAAELGRAWVPFREHQLGALTVAMLAPPQAWVGLLTIGAFVVGATVQFAMFSPEVRAHIAFGDPWATIAYGTFAIVVLVYRLRQTRVERDVARAQAEAESFELCARAMVALRDLANTPMQTMSNVVELLRAHDARSRELADTLERAVARMIELERLTRPYERQLHWRTGDEAWDPKAILHSIAKRTGPEKA